MSVRVCDQCADQLLVERSEQGRQVRRELRHAEQDVSELREQMTSASGHRQVSLLHLLCDRLVMLDTL